MAQGLEIRRKRQFRPLSLLFWLLIIALLAASGWFGYRYFTAGEVPPIVEAVVPSGNPDVDETPVDQSAKDKHTVAAGLPRYISIPDIGVGKTRVFQGGVDASNLLQSPGNIDDAMWYGKSALPGQGSGAVLINAHNGGVSRNGVFAQLGRLSVGQDIVVERGDGETFTYSVVENESMPLEEVNKTGMAKMMKSADEMKEGLNLITCDGKWVPRLQQFDRRIMLRAVIKA